MKSIVYVLTLFIMVSCINQRHDEQSIKIENNYIDLPFDECVDSFYVRKLISNNPLTELYLTQVVDDQLFIISEDDRIIYYLKNDSVISKLDAFGRGRGEYFSISGFAYSKEDSILYIGSAGSNKILSYKVPSFSFISSIDCDLELSTMTFWAGKIIAICHTSSIESPRLNGIYEIDVKTGDYKKILDVDYLSAVNMGLNNISFSDSELLISVPGFDNIIYKVTNGGLVPTNEFHYGEMNLDRTFFNVDETNSKEYADKMVELSEKEYCLGGSYPISYDSNNCSFWRCVNIDNEYVYLYTILHNELSSSYKLYIPGFSEPVIPFCVNNRWYMSIIEGPVESVVDDESILEGIGLDVIKTLKEQTFDNPILLYYKIKETI